MSLSNILNQYDGAGVLQQAPAWSNLNVVSLNAVNVSAGELNIASPFSFQQIGGNYQLGIAYDTAGLPIADNTVITDWRVFTSNSFDTGDFNQSTGIFTSPKEGKYRVSFAIQLKNLTGQVTAQLVKGTSGGGLDADAMIGFNAVPKQMYFQYNDPGIPTFSPPLVIPPEQALGVFQCVNGDAVVHLEQGTLCALRLTSHDGTPTTIFPYGEEFGNVIGTYLNIVFLGV
jgi:hypothetical protein